MELNDSDDLIKFINKQKKDVNELDLYHAYKLFCRDLPKIITTMYKKIYTTNIDAVDIIIAGCNMYYSVYWFILRYTNNCGVASFLAETSINLFLNSIITSHETLQDNPFKILPNISDSIKFAYKKTIGPLNCTTEHNSDIDNPQMAGQIIKIFILHIMKQLLVNNILPNKKQTSEFDSSNEMIPRIEILIDFIQNQNKLIIQSIWHIIYFIINKDSDRIADKLYYQIVHYVENYSISEEQKKLSHKPDNEIEWVNQKQKQIIGIYNNIKMLVNTIKEFSDEV